MIETKTRSIIKALSYRVCGSIFTGIVVWAASGRLDWAGISGIVDLFVKLGLFYCHERIWDRISYGRRKPPDFEI